jgi:DNA helicase-2/ATP-dependent DNA helicase PcrA
MTNESRHARLVRGLTPSQREAVLSDDRPLCVLASAGSGKTTVLTRRVARRVLDGSADPSRCLVVTFTRKAAKEIGGRLERIGVPGGVWAGTFHAAAYSQLRRLWHDRSERVPGVLAEPSRLVRDLLAGEGREATGARGSRASWSLASAIADDIQWARARMVSADRYEEVAEAEARRSALGSQSVARLYDLYEAEKRRRGLVDLDDLIETCASLIEDDPRVAELTRWRVRHLYVDEFQDLNPAQWRLLKAWLGDRDDLFVVGDPLQSVYGWNGSDPRLLDRLPVLLPGTRVLLMSENHRSSPQIVSTAGALVRRYGLVVDTVATPPGRKGDGPAPVVRSFDSDTDEALAVARWLRSAHRPGRSWSQLAVLARTNARLSPVAETLSRLGIPYRLNEQRTPTRLPEQLAEDGGKTSSHADAGGRPTDATSEALARLRVAPRTESLRCALAEIVTSLDELPVKLLRLADEYASEDPDTSARAFVAWVAATSSEDELGRLPRDAVQLTTFHKAKGLEWDSVAVIGLEDGTVPIAYAQTDDSLAEECRLLYVALTRAEERLWCSWAATREENGRSWSCEGSRYLDAVLEAVRALDPPQDKAGMRARVDALRSQLVGTS